MPVILACGELRKENHKCKACLCYIAKGTLCHKTKTNKMQ
jgi:hypothetical protein